MSPVNFLSLSAEEKQIFVDSFDFIISDCDGVIWTEKPINGAAETMKALTEAGKIIYYLSNNSTKTRERLLDKFKKYNFPITKDNVLNTSFLTANYLKNVLPPGKKVYIVGSPAIQQELHQVGIESFGPGTDPTTGDILEGVTTMSIELRNNVGAVVVGFDQHINYIKMLKACTYLKDNNCLYVCTNTDEMFPSSSNYVLPGTGAINAGILTACGREPFIIGKPSTYSVDVLLKSYKINPERTLFIGDRCNTDIVMGNKCNFKTLLVLTGVHKLEDVIRYQNSSDANGQMSVPHYYTNSIADLNL